jgi:broad specificity phosphatase PhoE
MITTLYLIRHGETEGGSIKSYKGSLDVPLSEKGRQQMERTSLFTKRHIASARAARSKSYLSDIHGIPLDLSSTLDKERPATAPHIYCSDLDRASASADIIARSFGVIPIQSAELRERHFGIWEGMTINDIKGSYPVEFERWASDPLKYHPPGGETTLQVKKRVVNALKKILPSRHGRSHYDDTVIIVAHGGVNRVILCHILGIPLKNLFRIEQDNGAVNIIEFWQRYPVLKALNLLPQ